MINDRKFIIKKNWLKRICKNKLCRKCNLYDSGIGCMHNQYPGRLIHFNKNSA